ncbi:beta-lactamase family protein [Tieghemostelium lacteum]|uniref:Beta-lactamase family protein n=1 Tax=Tieghemostelium lacteum TaxID=361077 RepID=A0A151ZD98_TIELA|nr:beta-lactamase family protein [Tieghemostelium lacteum]|eukprot:KYQ91917.1 beta-lactamase family protein [Tieghemostelium lacteum]
MKNIILLILSIVLVKILLTHACPDYPKPIKINQNDPLLVKAYAEVDSMIQQNMKSNGIKSFMATIVYRDEIVWSKGYGNVRPLDPTSPPLTIDNAVRIASITKVFTDVMMFQLRDKGVISLDEPISKYYPEFTVRDMYNTKRLITFRELASHQSGLPREVPCDFELLPTSNCTERIILERLAEQFLILPVYTQTHYSNLGIAALGRTLGKAAQMEYEQYVEEKILHPLGMKNASFSYDKVKDYMATGLLLWPNGTYTNAEILGLGWGTPMGGLYATARDMSKFMMFWLNGNDDVLDSSTVKEALSPIALITDGVHAYGTPFEMAYDTSNNIWMKSKAGALDGYRTQMALVKELKLGVFFSSLMYVSSEDVFTQQALDILLPVYEALLYRENSKPENANQMLNDLVRPIKSREEEQDKKPEIPFETFVGTYAHYLGVFRVDNTTYPNELTANFGDNNIFNVTRFAEDYPYILRIHVSNPEIYPCVFVDDGENYELVYFKVNPNDENECESVQVMGQNMSLISRDPTIEVANTRPYRKFL